MTRRVSKKPAARSMPAARAAPAAKANPAVKKRPARSSSPPPQSPSTTEPLTTPPARKRVTGRSQAEYVPHAILLRVHVPGPGAQPHWHGTLSANYLPRLADRMFSMLSFQQVIALRNFLHRDHVKYATACSGTDAPVLVMEALENMLTVLLNSIRLPEGFSSVRLEEPRTG